VHPAEGLFVQVEPLFLASLRFDRIECSVQIAFGLLQLVKKFGTNGEQVASGRRTI